MKYSFNQSDSIYINENMPSLNLDVGFPAKGINNTFERIVSYGQSLKKISILLRAKEPCLKNLRLKFESVSGIHIAASHELKYFQITGKMK